MNSVRALERLQGQKHWHEVIYQYKQNFAILFQFEGNKKIFEKNQEWNSQKYFLQFFLSKEQMVGKNKDPKVVDTTLPLVLNPGN